MLNAVALCQQKSGPGSDILNILANSGGTRLDEEGVCYEYWWDFVWWEYAGHVNDDDDHEDDDVVKRGRGNRLALSKGDGPQTG